MSAEFLLEAFARYGERTAIAWNGGHFSYAWLAEEISQRIAELDGRKDSPRGAVLALSADYSPHSLAYSLSRAPWVRPDSSARMPWPG